MQRETFSHNGAQVEKITHPDGSMDVTIQGCGDAMCPGDSCRMRDAVVTLHVDANGKRTYNGVFRLHALPTRGNSVSRLQVLNSELISLE